MVTGGTRGIGLAITLRVARAGASVIAGYVIDEDSAQKLLNRQRTKELSITTCRADLTSKKGLERLEEALIPPQKSCPVWSMLRQQAFMAQLTNLRHVILTGHFL